MNTKSHPSEHLLQSLIDIVNDIIALYADRLVQMAIAGDRRQIDNERHLGNFLSEIDRDIHSEYQARLARAWPSFVYVSEEGKPWVFPPGQETLPDLLFVVDPLDSSELAVRGLHAHTHIVAYSLKEQAPLASVVGDMFHDVRFFCACQDQHGGNQAFLMRRDGQRYTIKSSPVQDLHKALVTSYSMRPRERFLPLAKQQALLEALAQPNEKGEAWGRIGVDFGSMGLCHVAAGFTDATIEIARGFKLWDLYPGQYILCAAGGVVASLDGKELLLDLNLHDLSDIQRVSEKRQKFVAAGNPTLLHSILSTLE